jgi:hypothetical protein
VKPALGARDGCFNIDTVLNLEQLRSFRRTQSGPTVFVASSCRSRLRLLGWLVLRQEVFVVRVERQTGQPRSRVECGLEDVARGLVECDEPYLLDRGGR